MSTRKLAKEQPGAAPDAPAPTDVELPTSIVALQILEALSAHRKDIGVTAMADLVGVPKARMHRHLTALKEHDFVAQNPQTSQYRLGWRMYSLSRAVAENFGIGLVSRPMMEELSRQVDQTVVLSQQSGSSMVVVDYVMGNHMMAARLSNGQKFPLHAVAQGKVALAFGDVRVRERILRGPLQEWAPKTITDPARLQKEVEAIRRNGWSDAPEEMFEGLNAIAVPIFSAEEGLAGTLTIVGAVHVLTTPPPKAMLHALRETGRRVSIALGAPDGLPHPER